jgi:hypothetical protein
MTGNEAYRLGFGLTAAVRVRDEPDGRWSNGPFPPDLADYIGKPIPDELRGRRATVVKLGPDGFKYSQMARVSLPPAAPGERHVVVDVPLIWLQADDSEVKGAK